jgi:hypothetical protein
MAAPIHTIHPGPQSCANTIAQILPDEKKKSSRLSNGNGLKWKVSWR